jgi:uncharacterized membrane protein
VVIIRGTVVVLCGLGLYASAFMARKARLASRDRLSEPSVVETSRARAIAGVPNALFGLAYYGALALATPFLQFAPVFWAAFGAAAAAAAFSVYLAYSLLFVTKMPCPYCWTGHVVNWSLLALVSSLHPR